MLLQAKVLPLRLHVDQDALDFLKQFFSFKDPDAAPPAAPSEPSNEIYFRKLSHVSDEPDVSYLSCRASRSLPD